MSKQNIHYTVYFFPVQYFCRKAPLIAMMKCQGEAQVDTQFLWRLKISLSLSIIPFLAKYFNTLTSKFLFLKICFRKNRNAVDVCIKDTLITKAMAQS